MLQPQRLFAHLGEQPVGMSRDVVQRRHRGDVYKRQGLKIGCIRPITVWPFPTEEIAAAAEGCKGFLCVEMSMGQMVDDVRLAVNGKVPVSFFGRTGGVIPTPAEVLGEIEKMAGGDR